MAFLKKRERTDTMDNAFKFDDDESVERYLIQILFLCYYTLVQVH